MTQYTTNEDLLLAMEPIPANAPIDILSQKGMAQLAEISAAISLKRIADKLCHTELPYKGCEHCGHPMTNCVC